MSDLASRLVARAALTSTPETLVSADEVALLLDLDPSHAARHTPSTARHGRAPWSAWLITLGYASPDDNQPTAELEPGPPLTTWRAVAEAIGVSHDTLGRRRHQAGHKGRPYFEDAGLVAKADRSGSEVGTGRQASGGAVRGNHVGGSPAQVTAPEFTLGERCSLGRWWI